MSTPISWQCPHCLTYQTTENHSCPAAHYPSMICEHCGAETEGCLCDQAITLEDLEYFFAQPGINRSGICEEAGILRQTMDKILNWQRPLSAKVIVQLYPVMRKYGFRQSG